MTQKLKFMMLRYCSILESLRKESFQDRPASSEIIIYFNVVYQDIPTQEGIQA